jgi:hypothetical protein
MDVLKQLTRKLQPNETLASAVFVITALVAFWKGAVHTLLAGLAVFLIVIGLRPKAMVLAFLSAALAILLFMPSRRSYEGFEDASGATTDASGEETASSSGADEEKPKTSENFAGDDKPAPIAHAKPMLPDNRERMEPLVLGKPYKLPSEKDDQGIHLDAGTTFLNAYKALKPDQIAAMTKDTQELLATQKSLVAMLDSFGPMLKDMNKITGFFNA